METQVFPLESIAKRSRVQKLPASAEPHPGCNAQTSLPPGLKPRDDTGTPSPTMHGFPTMSRCPNGEPESSNPVESTKPAASQTMLSECNAHGCPAPTHDDFGDVVQVAAQTSCFAGSVGQCRQPDLDFEGSRAGRSNNSTAVGTLGCCNTSVGGGGNEVARNAARVYDMLWAARKCVARILGLSQYSADLENRRTLSRQFQNVVEHLEKECDQYLGTICELRMENNFWYNQIGNYESKISDLTAEKSSMCGTIVRLEESKAISDSKVVNLIGLIEPHISKAAMLAAQLSRLEQTNSKNVSGTGAHQDSPATPPNLLKSVCVMREAALAYTKSFIALLMKDNIFHSHEAVRDMPPESDERFRKYGVEAYICSRLFAGFETDRYVDDSLDSRYPCVPAHIDQEDFFLRVQDLELRHQQYLSEYKQLQEQGLQGCMQQVKEKGDFALCTPFGRFCWRKLVKIVRPDWTPTADDAGHSFLHDLAMNSVDCEKILKPFLNLARNAFMLHRLAFQFNPPARIFRYARNAPFDPTFMETAIPIDDDDIAEDLVVGHMLVPGFQVGATVIKCSVFLIPGMQ